MEWTLPGTVLKVDASRPKVAEETVFPLFLTGGLVLSQVTQIAGLQQHIVQNWVRRGFLPPPQGRKYTKSQFCRILTINALKSALAIEDICRLLQYVNGALDDAGDDTIDDAELYGAFVSLARVAALEGFPPPERLPALLEESLGDYQEPIPGARKRIEEVLGIMLMAWRSSELQTMAQKQLKKLPQTCATKG